MLADSEPLHLRSYQDVLDELGIALAREEYYAHYLGFDDVTAFKAIARRGAGAGARRRSRAIIERKTVVFDDIDCLDGRRATCSTRRPRPASAARRDHAARHRVGRAAPRDRADPPAGRLDDCFRFIVAAGETAASKPAPTPIGARRSCTACRPDSCVAIEDSRWGIESAKGAGLCCIGITQTYPVSELLEADVIVTSFAELTPELIKNLT